LMYLFVPRPKETQPNRRLIFFAVLAFVCVAAYWMILRFAPVPGIGAGHLDSYGNFPAYVDRAVFGLNHLYVGGTTPGRGVTYDPEGLLSTLPALFNTFAGICTAEFLRSPREAKRKFVPMLGTGVGLILLGLMLSHWMPLGKKLWTSPFAIATAGISLTVFSLLYYFVDIKGERSGTTPFLGLGRNSIAVYMVSNFVDIGLNWHFWPNSAQTNLRDWIYVHAYHSWLPACPASLLYALVMIAFYMLLFWPLYRKRIFVRI
jgi:predicted acyltransferase